MEHWDKSWFTQGTGSDGQTKPICMRHNLSQCTSQRCACIHCCPVPKCDGTMCGSTDHKAISCPSPFAPSFRPGTAPGAEFGDRRRGATAQAALHRLHHRIMHTAVTSRQSTAHGSDDFIGHAFKTNVTVVINGAAVQQ